MKNFLLLTSFIMLSWLGSYAQNFNYLKKISGANNDSSRVAGDNLGASLSLSGNYAILGSPDSDWDSAGANYKSGAGNAQIWERNPSTGVWGRVKKLSPRGSGGADSARVASDFMGTSVGISGDYCIVSSRDHDYDSTGLNFLSAAGAAFIWERNSAGAWTQVKKLAPPDRQTADQFSTRVAIDGNYAVVGAPGHDRDSAGGNFKSNAGAVWVYERVNGAWGFTKKLTPPNIDSARVASDNFGAAVAVSGNYIAVGANGQDWDSAGGNFKSLAGAVYIFERRNGVWGYAKKLTPPNTDSARVASDQFGQNIALEGTTLVVGSVGQDYDSIGGDLALQAGAAYVFERNNGVWGYVKKITPPSNTSDSARKVGDGYGNSVSISGNDIIIGASQQDWDSTASSYKSTAGAAYHFKKVNGVWGYTKKLSPPNTDSARVAGDRFGTAVAVSGNYALISSGTVGAGNDWDSAGGNYKSNAGAAYFFQNSSCELEYNNGWVGSSPSGSTGICVCNITAGTATIAASSALSALTVNSGATASLSGDLNISGDYTNNGTVSGAGRIVLNGSSAQSIYGTGTTGNLQLNNSAGATIQDSLGINGILTLTTGTLTTNGKLKLEATGATTYGQIAGTGSGTLSGSLTAEMQINGGGADWRPVCSPVSGVTLAQLSDDVNFNFGTPENSYATVYYFNEQTSPFWTIPSGTSAAFGDSAYSIYMGGTSSWANPLPLTIDIQGTYRGTSDYTHAGLTRTGARVDSTGWHYIANPWPSGFLWDDANITINSGGVQGNQVWIYNQSAGAYQAFDGTDNGVIPPFHPLLIEVTTDPTSITLENAGRTTDSLINYFDKTSLPNFVEVQVSDANGKTDKVKFYTDDKATNGFDVMDGNKRPNLLAPNLYFTIEGRKANKEVWNTLPAKDEALQLSFEANTAGTYTFNFTQENIEANTDIELIDKLSGAKHNLTQGDYTFAHDLSNAINRFELRFIKKSGVGVEEVTESTAPVYVGSTGNTITINAPNTANYTVEVMDLLGRTVQAPVSFTGNQIQTVTVHGVSTGYYLVKINGNNVYKTVKVFLR
ncbi:MAG: T9SS type A sorting domain-containing protein [Bacteroidota bacterium]